MTKLQLRSFAYQLISFGILFIGLQFLIKRYTDLSGWFIPLTAFVVGTIFSAAISGRQNQRWRKSCL